MEKSYLVRLLGIFLGFFGVIALLFWFLTGEKFWGATGFMGCIIGATMIYYSWQVSQRVSKEEEQS
ncbi:hypothetical protein CUJ83_00020 [Methanocella sp. CWC-04]|uniref:Uncharacterized protein n=1 Tax=Methanooceanicella nereidis TaxID=2052831 RepID=A0AAP2W4F2_9EURY|nr:hypothetical protein [Methanocella sp. CWC-04]MCD1293383.1 hypothetical protein [Methanocella sp. CWC-04]